MTSAKVCPSCKQANNPTFKSCWQCGVDLASGGASSSQVLSKSDSAVRYFQVSTTKFTLFSLVTFGIYDLYWCYRNWVFVQRCLQRKISPFGRAFFAIFFIYDLFKTIETSARAKGLNPQYSSGMLAFGWIAFSVLGRVSAKIPNAQAVGWVIWFIALFGFIFILPVLKSIKYINESEGVDSQADNKLTAGQIILLVLGGIGWLLTILGWVLPQA